MLRLLIISFIVFNSTAYGQLDSINQFNESGKKNGYWVQYLDSLVCPTDSVNSYFYGYELYDNGLRVFKFTDRNKSWKSYKLVFDGQLPEKGRPILIDGTFKWYRSDRQIVSEEIYKNGSPLYYKSYSYSLLDPTSTFNEVLYFDKLYNNIRGTFYYEEYFDGKLARRYWFRKGRKEWKSFRIKEE